MRFLFLCLLIFIFDLVVFQSFQLAISDFSPNLIKGITIAYWSVFAGLIGWLGYYNFNPTTANNTGNFTVIRSIFYLTYFAKFLFLFFTLAFSLIALMLSGIAYLIPDFDFSTDYSTLFAKISVLLSGLPLFLMIYGILRNRHRYKVHQVKVPIKGLPKGLNGLKIVQISDIHSGSFTDIEPLKKGIDLINQAKADLVFFTGDLVNSVATEIVPYTAVFDKIKAKFGVFSVLGNHDYGDYVRWPSKEAKISNLNQLIATQKQMGWQLLMNENRLLTIKGEKIAVIGVENYSGSPRFTKYGQLDKAYSGSETASLKLLLSHDPSHWDAQIRPDYPAIDITFSGHTHGAQFGIEIEGVFKWSPIKYVYKQWAGLYQKGQQFLYVNRGFGYLGYPGRVGILPEITVLELQIASNI